MLTLYFAPGLSSFAGSGWALGHYSIADIHLFRLYWRLANSLKPAPEAFPNLTTHTSA
jgi:glutathione S-transferase